MTIKKIISLAVCGAFVIGTAAGISDSAQVSAASHHNNYHVYGNHKYSYSYSEYSRDLQRENSRHNDRIRQIEREYKHRTHSKHYREAINEENSRHHREVQRITRRYEQNRPYERTGPGGGGH